MTIKIITDFRELMRLAKAVGDAKKSGDVIALEKAQMEHDAYKELCLKSDSMNIGLRVGDFF